MPGQPSIRWRARDVAALKSAVTAYNRTVTILRKRYGDDVELPYKTTLEDERARISTRREFNQMMKTLGNILVRNKPGAQDMVTDSRGVKTIRYIVDENKRLARLKRIQSKWDIRREYPGFEDLSPAEQATLLSDSDLDLSGKPRVGAAGLEQAKDAVGSKLAQYVRNYLNEWIKNGGSIEVVRMVQELERQRPAELEHLFEESYAEFTIDYIYPNELSAYSEDIGVRYSKVEAFWFEKYALIMSGRYYG